MSTAELLGKPDKMVVGLASHPGGSSDSPGQQDTLLSPLTVLLFTQEYKWVPVNC